MKNHSVIFLVLLVAVSFGIMEWTAIADWQGGRWFLADVGNIQYTLVNSWYGDFMWSPMVQSNHFAYHFTPFFILLMPFVWLSDFPVPLITLYTLALAATPIPLYYLARQAGLSGGWGVLLGLLFICNHYTGSVQVSYHFENFYILGALCTFALFRTSRQKAFWICVILTLGVKEDAAVWLGGFAAWFWVFHKDSPYRNRALRLLLVCIGWFVVALGTMWLISKNQQGDASYYAERMGGIRLGFDNLLTILYLLFSFALLPLLSRKHLLLILIPVPVILGRFVFTRYLQFYYSYPFLPFLGLASVEGLAFLIRWLKRFSFGRQMQIAAGIALTFFCCWQYFQPTLPGGTYRVPYSPSARDDFRRQIASQHLPPDGPLAIQYNLWGVTPWRYGTLNAQPETLNPAQTIFLDLKGQHGLESVVRFEEYLQTLMGDVESGRRKILFNKHDFVVISPQRKDEI